MSIGPISGGASGGGGSGDVVGPASATDNALVRFDGASGDLVQSSPVQVSDSGAITGATTISLNNTGLKLKDTDASHELTIAPGTNLGANRTLTLTTGDANRNITMSGDLTFGGTVNTAAAFSTSGANALTLTTTAPTNVTLPTTGTLATLSNKVTDFTAPTSSLSMNSQKITNLANAVDAQDAATKADLDVVASGLIVKANCNYASTANVAGTYVGSPIFTLTAGGVGALSIDGSTPSVNDRILLKDQTDAKENGIWTVTIVGDGGTAYVLTRATDFDASAEIVTGNYVFIIGGTTNASRGFYLITPATITLDTTSLAFTQFISANAYSAGAGLTLSGSTFNIGSGTGIGVEADYIEVDFAAVQAKSATLDGLAAFTTEGYVAMTSPDVFESRDFLPSGSPGKEGISIVNGDGIAGNTIIGLDMTYLNNEPTPDPANDYAVLYDASSGTNKKALLGTFTTSGVYFHQVGTTPIECWYSSAVNSLPTTTIAMAVAATTSTMYAVPFIPVIGGTLDRIAFNVNVAVASTVARVGIYKNTTSSGQLYPDELLVDGGESATTSVGTKAQTISASLTPGQLYWFVLHADNTTAAATGPTLRAISAGAMPSVLGTSSAFGPNPNTHLLIAGQTYGALPANFPAGATPSTNAAPAAIVRFSA